MSKFQLSINLEYGFTEAGDDPQARVRAAARAGFDKVELFFTHNKDVPALAGVLDAEGVQLWTVFAGPRMNIADPSTHGAFLDLFRRTAEDACVLRCPHVVVSGGMELADLSRSSQEDAAADVLSRAAEIASDLGVTALVEAVNTDLHPGLFLSKTAQSCAVVRAVGSPRVKVLYDMYHSIVEQEDPRLVVPTIGNLLGHVQIADVPGRGEPGSGAVDWVDAFDVLQSNGYSGVVGVECQPTRPSVEAFTFIKNLAANQ